MTAADAIPAPRIVIRSMSPDLPAGGAPVEHTLQVGEEVSIGREADLPLGVDPVDPGISRLALTVLLDVDGWHFTVHNRNGASLHPWGKPQTWLRGVDTQSIRWPLVGVRLLGSADTLVHWVLLEHRGLDVRTPKLPLAPKAATVVPPRPNELTFAQRVTVQTVFAEHLAWPPRNAPTPSKLDAAGRRLGISYAAVVQRLEGARNRAHSLGVVTREGVTDPAFVHALVEHGYLPLPKPTDAP